MEWIITLGLGAIVVLLLVLTAAVLYGASQVAEIADALRGPESPAEPAESSYESLAEPGYPYGVERREDEPML